MRKKKYLTKFDTCVFCQEGVVYVRYQISKFPRKDIDVQPPKTYKILIISKLMDQWTMCTSHLRFAFYGNLTVISVVSFVRVPSRITNVKMWYPTWRVMYRSI